MEPETSRDETPVVFLDRTSRATRGKRMTKLLDEELQEDELFWKQDAFNEDENDDEYEEEAEAADEFDSDFNEEESEPEAVEENDAQDIRPPKKRLIYPGKLPTKKNKKKDLSEIEKPSIVSSPPENYDVPDDAEGEKSVRKSTRTSVIVRQAERDAIRAALQATTKPVKRKKEGEEKKMTQEEMLLEAAQTEIMNLRNLERVLAREEEVKKKAVVHKAVFNGPQIRYSSKNGQSCIEFSKGLSFDSQIVKKAKAIPHAQKEVCAVTGLPAKYRDPKTGLPYATKEAFQVLRERYLKANNGAEGHIETGHLSDSITGQGFSGKRKRSMPSGQNGTSSTRCLARFRRVPAADSQDSE